MSDEPHYEIEWQKFRRRLPSWAGAALDNTLGASAWLRWPAALLLIFAGVVGTFLPILGFWMVPLGLVLVAQDIPFLHPPLARIFAWINRKWPA